MLYLCRVKPLRHYLRGFLIAAWAGDKIAEFSFPEISFHFPLRPWFFFVSPAYAGKRAVLPYAPAHSGDHPRVCGEKARMRSGLSQQKGSPPRMRGKDLLIEHCLFTEGITPAYAGKSRYLMRKSGEQKDHPRVCGEKELRQAIAVQHIGSPPRMRGKVAMFCRAVRAHRITPAYAGKREQAQ